MPIPVLWVRHPFVVPSWGRQEVAAALAAAFAPPDRESNRLREQLAERFGPRPMVLTASGRFALELALRSLGVGPGSEVILPTFGCAALVEALRRAGASAAFADVDHDFNVSPQSVEALRSSATRAVIVVHAGGKRADIEAICGVAHSAGIAVIEDCAQAMGGTTNGAPWGLAGDAAIFSFGMGKNIMASAGGLLLNGAGGESWPPESRLRAYRRLAAEMLAFRLRRYTRPFVIAFEKRRSRPPEDMDSDYPALGLSDVDAAMLRVQLRKLDTITSARQRNARALIEELGDESGLDLPDPQDHVFTKFYVRLTDATRPSLDGRASELLAFVRALLRAGFEPELAYTPLHLRFPTPRPIATPVADDVYWRTIALPVGPELHPDDCRRMAQVIRRFLRAQ